jgi:hypothetical protein
MKKFTLLSIVATLFFTITIQAQIKKGSVFLGGDLGGSTQKTKKDGLTTNNQNGLNISPVFGKAIKENLILGADIGFGLYENNYSALNPSTDQRSNSYHAGVFLRKYKAIGKSGFSAFLQGKLSVEYNSIKYDYSASNFDNRKRNTISVSTYPGISYTVSRRIQLETGFNNLLNLGYFTEKRDVGSLSPYTEKTNGISISSSLNNLSSLYLGFRVLINK